MCVGECKCASYDSRIYDIAARMYICSSQMQTMLVESRCTVISLYLVSLKVLSLYRRIYPVDADCAIADANCAIAGVYALFTDVYCAIIWI